MKKAIIAGIAAVLVTAAAAGIPGVWSASKAAAMYPTAARVVSVDRDADAITVETSTGFRYTAAGAEDWTPGDLAALLMDDAGTPENIGDDRIITARYAGF